MKILFICKGNVGRSQIAEVIFNKIKGKEHEASSAGTKVNESQGRKLKEIPLAEPVIRFMKEEGFNISENFQKQVTEKMVNEVDKVITMAEKETLPNFIIGNPKAIFWDIEDPKGKTDEQYKHLIQQLREKIEYFIKENNLQ